LARSSRADLGECDNLLVPTRQLAVYIESASLDFGLRVVLLLFVRRVQRRIWLFFALHRLARSLVDAGLGERGGVVQIGDISRCRRFRLYPSRQLHPLAGTSVIDAELL